MNKYPRIVGASKHKKKNAKCKCGAKSTHLTSVQVNYMRGDYYHYWTCDEHKRDLDFLRSDIK